MKAHATLTLLLIASLASVHSSDEPGPTATDGPLIIHELDAVGGLEVMDDDGDEEDWFEIWNRSDASVSLAGWSVTEGEDVVDAWPFPEMEIAAGGYLLVYASGKDRRDLAAPLHTDFKLGAEGEPLRLIRPDGSVSHGFDPAYPAQREGYSYGLTGEGTYRYFSRATPGEANDARGECFIDDLVISVAHGFYEDAFEVEITCPTPEVTIRFTVDGNEPSAGTLFGGAKGEVYEGPITIDGTTVLRAQATRSGWNASHVATQTYIFLEDVVGQSPNGETPEGWPDGSVNGQVFDFGLDPEVVNDPAYADQLIPALRAIPTMSLVMDQEDLTDRGDGIYVNANQDGRDWERPGSLELLNPDGSEGFQINAGVRIRGGFSRTGANPKHSFRMFFRDEYGENALRYPLFGDEGVDEFKKFDFRTAQNYAWSLQSSNDASRNTFLREVFARDSQRALGKPYTRSRYYHLYLNGQYWGLYMSQERAEADYAESYFEGEQENYDVIKVEAGPYTVYATAGSIDAFYELHELVSGDLTDADFYALQGKNPQGEDDPSLPKHIDVENLIDYMLIIFYVGSFDAPLAGTDRANNFYAIRDREERDGWRFFAHDTEHSMLRPAENRMGPYPAGRSRQHFNPQYLHQQLMQSDAYRLLFADHVRREFFHDGVFTTESALKRWRARQAQIDLAIIAESARWGDQHERVPYTKEDWLTELEWVEDVFFDGRTETVYAQMEDVGLTGDLQTPEFRPDGGVIDDPSTFTFSLQVGTLFKPQPGDIYYTLDGSDPRMPDGSVSDRAMLYERSQKVPLDGSAIVKTRLLNEGSWSPLNAVTYTHGALATAENLVISEIMYHPAAVGEGSIAGSESAFEYLELWNPSDMAVDLTGATFANGLNFAFPATGLDAGQRGVLVSDANAFAERYGTNFLILGEFGGDMGSQLSNSGERLAIHNIHGEVVVDFRYSDDGDWPTLADGDGASLQLIGEDPADPSAWVARTDPLGVAGLVDPQPSDAAILVVEKASDGTVRLQLPQGVTTIEYSTDLSQWQVITTDAESIFTEVDAERLLRSTGYYRAILP